MRLFGGTIAWRTNKQDTVTTSTTEAELLALSQTVKELLYLSRLLKEFLVDIEDKRITIQCDNQQTLRLVIKELAVLITKFRHVDIHNHWLRQKVSTGHINVAYTASAANPADGLTKPLQHNAFKTFIQHVGLVDIADLLEKQPSA